MSIIQKVRTNKVNGQKVVTVPKDSDIESGDYVQIIKVVLPRLKDESS